MSRPVPKKGVSRPSVDQQLAHQLSWQQQQQRLAVNAPSAASSSTSMAASSTGRRWLFLGGTPQVLDYVLTRASFTELDLATFLNSLVNTGRFAKEDLEAHDWIVPFLKKKASRGMQQQMCLRQNAIRTSSWACTCTQYYNACVLCDQMGHGAFFFQDDGSFTCAFHNRYDRQQRWLSERWAIQEMQMDAAIDELVAWRRANRSAPIPTQQDADAAVQAAATALAALAAPVQSAPVVQPDRPTVIAVQVVKDFVDQRLIETARVRTVADLLDLLEDVPYQLPRAMKLYTSRPSASHLPAELTDEQMWQLHGLNPPGQVFAYYVTEAGVTAAAAEAASLFCHVPNFEQHPLWNPTGDLYSIRPIDLLRRLYDELGLALRWFVVDHLSGTDTFFEPGGIKKTQPTKLFFSAHDMQRSEKGKVTKELHVVALNDEAYKHARICLSNPNVKAANLPKGTTKGAAAAAPAAAATTGVSLWPSDEAKCVHRDLDGFFSLRCAWDCDKLLQHIMRNKRNYTVDGMVANPCTAAGQLFKLRNMVFHRSFLAQGEDADILNYTIRAVRLFFLLADRLFKHEEQNELQSFDEPFRAHRNQLANMRKLAEHMFNRLGHPAVEEAHVQGYLQSMLLDPHFNSSDHFPLQMQLALSFGTRFSKPLTFGGTQAAPSSALQQPQQPAVASAVAATSESIAAFSASSSGALSSVPSGQVVTLLSRSKVQRWEWNVAAQAAVQGGYPLSDPLGVNLADVLWRGLDAMSVILHKVLFMNLWQQHEFRAPALARVKELYRFVLNDEAGFELAVLIPKRQARGEGVDEDGVDLETEEVSFYRDPSLLLQSLRAVVEQMDQTDALRQLLDDITSVLSTRDQLAHQYYMEKPADITVASTRDSMKSVMRVAQGAVRLINREQRADVNAEWHRRPEWRLLSTLQEAVCSDDIRSARGNYKKYRDRQQVGIKERAFELKHTESVRRVLQALLISTNSGHLRVARALLDRFNWRPRANRSSTQKAAASSAASMGPIFVDNLYELLIDVDSSAAESSERDASAGASAAGSATSTTAAAAQEIGSATSSSGKKPPPKGRYNRKK